MTIWITPEAPPPVLRGVPTASVWGDASDLNAEPCRRGQRWTWDGVAFAVLHPPAGFRRGRQ